MTSVFHSLTHCPMCEYDLTGLPANYQCPECDFEYDESMRICDTSGRRAIAYVGWFAVTCYLGLLLTGHLLLKPRLGDPEWAFDVVVLFVGLAVSVWALRGVRQNSYVLVGDRGLMHKDRRHGARFLPWGDLLVTPPFLAKGVREEIEHRRTADEGPHVGIRLRRLLFTELSFSSIGHRVRKDGEKVRKRVVRLPVSGLSWKGRRQVRREVYDRWRAATEVQDASSDD